MLCIHNIWHDTTSCLLTAHPHFVHKHSYADISSRNSQTKDLHCFQGKHVAARFTEVRPAAQRQSAEEATHVKTAVLPL